MIPTKRSACGEAIRTAIPAAIANLPSASLLEKIVLAEIDACPTHTNAWLALQTGMSGRGIEAMLLRFREKGWLGVQGKGRARRLMILFPVEHNKKCGDITSAQPHVQPEVQNNLRNQRRPMSLAEEYSLRVSLYSNCMTATAYDAALHHRQAIRRLIETATDISQDKKCEGRRIVDEAENRCNVFAFAKEMAAGLPDEAQRRIAIAVATASPGQLADLRERINRGLPAAEVKLLLTTAENAPMTDLVRSSDDDEQGSNAGRAQCDVDHTVNVAGTKPDEIIKCEA
jgi:hypothetical protein